MPGAQSGAQGVGGAGQVDGGNDVGDLAQGAKQSFHLAKAPVKKYLNNMSSSDEFLLNPTRENQRNILK